ncbi:MAG: ABC transporter [Desulfobacterales bacterium]|nr:MAG: ABC transporter [Desulfobacterales bacterium]
MFNDYGYAEDRIGDVTDRRLLAMLLPFLRPYARHIALAVVLVLGMTVLDIAMPWVVKTTIDRHIVPPPSTQDTPAPADGFRAGIRRHITVNADEPDIRALVKNILTREPDLLTEAPDGKWRIRREDLSRLPREEQLLLRRKDIRGVWFWSLLYFLLLTGSFLLHFGQLVIMERAGQGVMHDMRLRLYDHLQRMKSAWLNRQPVGRLVTRTTNDVQNMNELFTSVVVVLFKDIFLLAGLMITMVVLHWRLALVCFAIIPFMTAGSMIFAHLARQVYRELRVFTAEINTRFSETFAGIRVLHLFRRLKENRSRFQRINDDFFRAGMKQLHIFSVFMPMIDLCASISLGLLIYYGGREVMALDMSLGILVAFISYYRMLFSPIRDMAEKYNILQNALSSAERIFRILETDETEGDNTESGDTKSEGAGTKRDIGAMEEIQLDGLSFSYTPGEPVLRSLELVIPAGSVTAVIGPTGSGKTSLIHLLLRFYDPDEGCIRFNGRDIRTIPLKALREKMALVSQDPFLFSESIRENIRLGARRNLSDDELREILSAARCGGILSTRVDGMDAPLSEGGISLSSGERQLVSIARAIARDPELIILDEATSYIDSATEEKVREALVRLTAGRTVILVAHRLSTARNADRIIVLRHGRIIETGKHEELLARKGFYADLWAAQMTDRMKAAGEAL